MSDYTNVAEQMKQSIIDDYLKKNPDLHRSEVVTKFVNGRVVVGKMSEILQNASSRKSVQDAGLGKNKKLLEELSKGGDVRYAECLTSVDSSNKYIDWLSLSRFTGFSDEDREDNVLALARLTPICNDRAIDLHEAKMKFANAMQGAVKPTRGLVQTLMAEYLQAFSGQVKSQRSIYKKEVDLGGTFKTCTGNFIQDNFSNIRSSPKPSVLKAVSRAVDILKTQKIDIGPILSEKDIKKVSTGLEDLGEKLEAQRKANEDLQKLVNFIDAIINEILPDSEKAKKESGEEEEDQEPAQEAASSQDSSQQTVNLPKKSSPDGGPRHRMAYSSKKDSGRGSPRRR